MYIKYIQGLYQSRLSTADYALFLVASATTAVNSLSLSLWSRSHIATDGQSVSVLVPSPMSSWPGIHILLFDNYGFAFVGCPLWREDGSVFCICCWSLPAQSFSDPSPLGLATVFYCLRFETSLFVASYDSQGHGGGIRSRLHTALTSH
jgi:hypothetical protein